MMGGYALGVHAPGATLLLDALPAYITETIKTDSHTAADLRRAIEQRGTDHGGAFHDAAGQVGVFRRQLTKRARDARDELAGRVRRDGTGRDHGYPGGRARPPRYDPADERR